MKVTDVVERSFFILYFNSYPLSEYNECTSYSEGQKSPGAALINGYANLVK